MTNSVYQMGNEQMHKFGQKYILKQGLADKAQLEENYLQILPDFRFFVWIKSTSIGRQPVLFYS
jgi:hypothetical protein